MGKWDYEEEEEEKEPSFSMYDFRKWLESQKCDVSSLDEPKDINKEKFKQKVQDRVNEKIEKKLKKKKD